MESLASWLSISGHTTYWLSGVLFLIGVWGILANPNLVRKLMAMNIMQVAVIVFFIGLAYKDGGEPPIGRHGEQPSAEAHVNPLPHTLMLTAIVVSVGTTGVALSLLIRIHRRFDTLNDEELIKQLKR